MALIAMAVYDTDENKRTDYTEQTLFNLLTKVDLGKNRIIISDNGSCEKTQKYYFSIEKEYKYLFGNGTLQIIRNEKNLGTAEAINKAWKQRLPWENAIKIDNDVYISSPGWVEEMEEAIQREPKIGIIGLKRKDCWEEPNHQNSFYRSELIMLPHEPGQRWIVVERVNHVMGTCQMYSVALLDRIGYLQQPGLYGFDDAWAAIRCKLAGFENVFLPHINIEHLDIGNTPYQKWKETYASMHWEEYHTQIADWKSGKKSIYYNPFENESKANNDD